MKVETTIAQSVSPEKPPESALRGASGESFETVFDQVATPEISAEKSERYAQLRDSFLEWRGELDTSHPLNLPRYESVMANSEAFLNIVENAIGENGHSDPVAFLSGLSVSELEVLRVMHSLADSIDPSELSREGALNLLLPFDSQRDIDNDGFVETGKAVGWRFPPPNAPQHVRAAWDSATEGMDFGERLMAEAMFFPSPIRLDESGRIVELERSETNNPYADTDFSYEGLFRRRLESIDAFRHEMTEEQYSFQKGLLESVLDILNKTDKE